MSFTWITNRAGARVWGKIRAEFGFGSKNGTLQKSLSFRVWVGSTRALAPFACGHVVAFPCVGVCGYAVRTECGNACGCEDLHTLGHISCALYVVVVVSLRHLVRWFARLPPNQTSRRVRDA